MGANEHILNLDFYIIPPVRIYIIPLGVVLVLFSLTALLNRYMNLEMLLVNLGQVILGVTILLISFVRKSLIFEHQNLYNSLTVLNKVLIKKKIDSSFYTIGNVERLEKSDMWSFSFIPKLLREYDGFSIVLQDEGKTVKDRLIKLTDVNKLNDTIKFIQDYSDIRFIKSSYKNHW